MQKGQTPRHGYAARSGHTVHSFYAVRSRCKVIVPPHTVDAVGMQYAVGLSAKKSLYPHAVDTVDTVRSRC